ncbi:O-antigen polymerase [Bacillus sp. FJAT-21945]|nr:O-antigen polymerase [Bacillus sp. FJAT-21945]
MKEKAQNSGHVDKVETESETEIRKIDKILTIGLLLIILIVPLVVRVHFADFVSPQITGTDMDSGSKTDIFTFYKFVLLLIGTLILSLIFLYKVIFAGYSIPKSKLNIFTGIFAVIVLLSAIFAPNKTIALFGMYNRHEGTLTYLCYIALFFIASNIEYTNKQLRGFIYILYPFVIVNVSLGLLSFFGLDILKYDFVKAILFSGLQDGSSLQKGSKFIATINHGNYVSGFASILIGLFLTWALLDKSKVRCVINLIFALVAFAMLLSSLSSSGFVTLLVILPVMTLLIVKAKNKRHFITILAAFLVVSSCIFTLMAKHNPQVWDETFGFVLNGNPFEESKLGFDWHEVFADKVYADEKVEVNFPNLPESGVGPGSGRLFIWGETWELVKNRPFLGYGLDTLTYFFPQNNPGIHENIGSFNTIIDKPHNIYIGILYGSGIVAFILFIVLVFSIFFRTLVTIIKDQNPVLMNVLFVALLTFLIQAMFNDSLIGTSVISWVFMGILLSLVEKAKVKL